MKKFAFSFYAALCYLLFNAVFLYLIAFQLNIIVPKTIDSGTIISPSLAVISNVFFIALFGAAHSIMARDRFKQWWIKIVPPAAERSTYVLQSSLFLGLIMWQWQPLTAVIWQVNPLPLQIILYALFAFGVSLVLLSTFQLNHFSFFGLEQTYRHVRQQPMPADTFRTPFLYRHVRHPLQLGLIIMLFAVPQMTVGHLLFSGTLLAYIFVGLHFEEKSLVRRFGDRYRRYQQTTPKLIPTFGLRLSKKTARPEPAEGAVSPTHQS